MLRSTVELYDLKLEVEIGNPAEEEITPEKHALDLTLSIDPSLVIIEEDIMSQVFDYDPIIKAIENISRKAHYQTQERLLTLIIELCAKYKEIKKLELFLYKSPVNSFGGKLGIRITLDEKELNKFRFPKVLK